MLWIHEVSTLENTHGQFWNDRQMLLEFLVHLFAEGLIVLQSLDLTYPPETLKRLVVHFVYLTYIGVRDNHVGERLHVSDPVGQPVICQSA